MTDKKKLVLMVTHGPENAELSTIPFVMATTALASDVEVLMGFQGNGVMLTIKGMADHVAASGFPPLKDLLKAYLEGGGKMYVCGPCVGSRMIAPHDLVEGATIVGAATFVAECVAATNVLVY
ncbi:MAG: DsrE family protein [Rhodocyclaceae bacterium]|nr:DsrE family protein [Rhodocyclaceae bacterium]